ncbi:SLBB domain-containing protein [Streptomyces sp. NPDC055722]
MAPRTSTTSGSGTGRLLTAPVNPLPAHRSHAAAPSHTAGDADAPAYEPAADRWRDRVGLAVRERMPLWLQSRCGLEGRSVAALSVLLVAAVAFAAQHFWTGRTQEVRAPEVVRAAASYGEPDAERPNRASGPGTSNGPPPTGGTGAGSGQAAEVVVDVGGKVRKPGLQRLPAGSRVVDALRAAGGVRPGTNTDGLNRARLKVLTADRSAQPALLPYRAALRLMASHRVV